jgi:hypothetical protein
MRALVLKKVQKNEQRFGEAKAQKTSLAEKLGKINEAL